jgi:hypothetical protein
MIKSWFEEAHRANGLVFMLVTQTRMVTSIRRMQYEDRLAVFMEALRTKEVAGYLWKDVGWQKAADMLDEEDRLKQRWHTVPK